MHRKGITPIIAILLLLMMTVAAAGGAYVWISTLQDQLQEQTSEQIQQSFNRDIGIVALKCWSDGTIDTVLKNSGNTELDLNPVDVRVRRQSNGNLVSGSSLTQLDFTSSPPLNPGETSDFSDPGSSAGYNISTTISPGNYRIQFVFTDEGNIQREGSCTI